MKYRAFLLLCTVLVLVHSWLPQVRGDSFALSATSDPDTTSALYSASYPDLRPLETSNWTLDYAVNSLTAGDVVIFRVSSDTRDGCELEVAANPTWAYGSAVVMGTHPPTVTTQSTAGQNDLNEVTQLDFGTVSSPSGGATGTVTVYTHFVVPNHPSIFGSDVKEVPGSGGATWTPCKMKGEVLVNGGAVYVQEVEYEIVDLELRVVKNLVGANVEVDAGDTVTFQVEVQHYNSPTGSQVRLSHLSNGLDVHIVDLMTPDLILVPNTVTITPGNLGYINVGNKTGDSTIEVIVPKLGPSDVVRIEYNAILNGSVGAASQIVNTAQVWLTRDGYGNTTKYQNDTETISTPAPETVFTILNSSLAETNYSIFIPDRMDVAIGETITVLIEHTIPEGSSKLNQFDVILGVNPGVMQISQVRSFIGSLQAQYPDGNPQFTDTNSDGINDLVHLDYGTVINVPDNVKNSADVLKIELDLEVPDRAVNVNGVQVSAQIVSKFGTGETVCHETRWNNGQSKKVLLPLDLGVKTAKEFYDYYDSYAHTGEEEWDRALMYFVRDVTNRTAFVLVYDKPTGPGAPAGHDGGAVYLHVDSDGLAGLNIDILEEDDKGSRVCPIDANTDAALATMKNDNYCWDVATGTGEFRHKWINTKTDGIVLGYFPNTNWCMRPTWMPSPWLDGGGNRYYDPTLEGITELAVMTSNSDGSIKKTFIDIAERTGLEICGFTCDADTGLLSSKVTSLAYDVVVPAMATSSTVDKTSGDASDVVAHTYTVDHDGPCALHSAVQNKSCSPLYDIAINVTLESGSLFQGAITITTTANYTITSQSSSDIQIRVPVLLTSQQVQVAYSRVIQQAVVPNSQVRALTSVTAYSATPSRGKVFTASHNDPFLVNAPAIVSVVVSATSQAASTKAEHDPALFDVVPGETVTYLVSLNIPEATGAMQLDVQLPYSPGRMHAVSSRVLSIGSNVNLGSGLGVGDSANVSKVPGAAPDNNHWTFDMGTVVNTADNTVDSKDVVVFEVVGVVSDYFNNTDGQRLELVTTLSYNAASLQASAVVECIGSTLSLSKTATVTQADYPLTFNYTLTVEHVGASSSPAYSLQLTDALPAALQVVDASSNLGAVAISGQTVTVTVATYNKAQPQLVLRISASVRSNVSALPDGTVLGNSGHVQWTVLDGVPATQATASAERNVSVLHICGNGGQAYTEQCDDGNTVGGDGCSANCSSVETGYQCDNSTIPSNCTLIGPRLLTAIADDPDDGDYYYSAGDTLTLSFDMATNVPDVSSKAAVDTVLSFAPYTLGQDYSGTWSNASTLRLTVLTPLALPPPALHSTNPFPAWGYPKVNNNTVWVRPGVKNAAATSLDAVSTPVTLTGDWGRLGPVITALVANDPDDADAIHSAVDTVTISFDRPVRQVDLSTKAALDASLTFNTSLGSNYTATWLSSTQLRITIVDATVGGSKPAIGSLAVTSTGTLLTDPTGFTLPSASTSPLLTGDWGTAPGPSIISIVANDPDDGDQVYSDGDVVIVTFNMATNKPSVSTFADVNALLSFSTDMHANYSGTWNGAGTVLTLTAANVITTAPVPSTTGSGPSPTITIKASGGLRNAASSTLPSGATSPQLTGNWGLPAPPHLLSAVADDPDDGDIIYSLGDTITVTFSAETNRPAAGAFTIPGGLSLSLAWQDNRTAIFTITAIVGTPPTIGSTTISIAATGVTTADGSIGVTTSELLGSNVILTGDWGQKAAPVLLSAVASDPDNADSIFSPGDVITLSFDGDTNTPSLANPGAVFTFSSSIGSNYSATWVEGSKRDIRITIIGTQGVTSAPVIASTSVSILPGVIRDADGTSHFTSQHTISSAPLSGNWGQANGPLITAVTAADPDNADSVFSDADVITIAFDRVTNAPSVASKAEVDNLLTFEPTLGSNYSAVWSSDQRSVVITIIDATPPSSTATTPTPFWLLDGSAVTPPFKVTVGGGRLYSQDLRLGPSVQTYTSISGNWGTLSAPAVQSVVPGDPDDGDAIFGAGDEIVITFAARTNEIAVATPSDIDKAFTFYKLAQSPITSNGRRLLQQGNGIPDTASPFTLGSNYTAAWSTTSSGASVLRIEIIDATGAHNVPSPGFLLARVHGYVRDQAEKSLPAQNAVKSDTSGTLISGDWGLLAGPQITIVVCDDPDKSEGAYAAGDTITLTFNVEPKHVAVATRQDLDLLLAWTQTDAVDSPSQSLGTDYSGRWSSSNVLVITVVDPTGAIPEPDPLTLTAHLRRQGNLTNVLESSLPGVSSKTATGSWGPGGAGAVIGLDGRALGESNCRTFWCRWWWLLLLACMCAFTGCAFLCLWVGRRRQEAQEQAKASKPVHKVLPTLNSSMRSPDPFKGPGRRGSMMSPVLMRQASLISPQPVLSPPPGVSSSLHFTPRDKRNLPMLKTKQGLAGVAPGSLATPPRRAAPHGPPPSSGAPHLPKHVPAPLAHSLRSGHNAPAIKRKTQLPSRPPLRKPQRQSTFEHLPVPSNEPEQVATPPLARERSSTTSGPDPLLPQSPRGAPTIPAAMRSAIQIPSLQQKRTLPKMKQPPAKSTTVSLAQLPSAPDVGPDSQDPASGGTLTTTPSQVQRTSTHVPNLKTKRALPTARAGGKRVPVIPSIPPAKPLATAPPVPRASASASTGQAGGQGSGRGSGAVPSAAPPAPPPPAAGAPPTTAATNSVPAASTAGGLATPPRLPAAPPPIPGRTPVKTPRQMPSKAPPQLPTPLRRLPSGEQLRRKPGDGSGSPSAK
eukprot:TRINITY_DN4929_c0_g1_i1.p1 TRINITY_DN4929_c0_g1~~TRINITY_DN4929_c0_g1_i1.p1  ORF type:complete len:2752 (-),score=612.36 TRINITY_DN4929_c0_g1_i1:92-8347(-)